MDYRRSNIELLGAHCDILGKRVLEVGGDSRGMTASMLLELGAGEVVVTNVGHGITDGQVSEKIVFRKVDARELHTAFPEGHFAAAFGVAVAEHIPDPAAWTDSLSKVLAPSGRALIHGGPIWSGPHGHHVWAKVDGVTYQFNDKTNPLEAWDHLLHDRASLIAYLIVDKKLPRSHAEAIARWVYEDKNINRVSYTQLVDAMGSGGMKVLNTFPNIYRAPDETMKARLAKTVLGSSERYEISGAAFLLEQRG